ncbi:PIN domain-containing protein [Candidatus Bathyarchaeota archaeon]|nr:PIN domain-containing protein [Candidatus Bathyarchaeota archaeon]
MSEGFLLDTTFIMPFFGIDVAIENFKEDLISLLSSSRDDLFITSCSLIEGKWKCIRNFTKSKNEEYLKRANNALESFQLNKYVKILDSWFVKDASKWADHLLVNGHQDYMDCWIAGTARALNLVLVTEDTPLVDLINDLDEWKLQKTIDWKVFNL